MTAGSELPPDERGDRPAPEPFGLSVTEFCAKYRCSRSGYAKAKKHGRGPDEVSIFGKQIISPEAEAAWLAQQRQRSRELAAYRFGGTPPAGAMLAPARSSTGKRLGRPPAGGWPADPPPPAPKKKGRPTREMVAARAAATA